MSKKKDFFWASYADLMTSLFFIMLVLFVLVVVMLQKEKKDIELQLNEFKKIEEIKESLNSINDDYFEYSPEYKKHIFKIDVAYATGKYDMGSLMNPNVKPDIENAGKEIKNLIDSMSSIGIQNNIQYLIIIEGQSSADNWHESDYRNNDVLSYLRALKLKEFWINNGINFNGLSNCELVVAGSGQGGIPRVETDGSKAQERANQRFLIHIIPKTGIID